MSTTRYRRPSEVAYGLLGRVTLARQVRWRAWVWWTPGALGVIYALTLLFHLHAVLAATWLSSDADIDAVLAHVGIHAPAGTVLTTGDFPHYESMAFVLLTRSLPFYRVLWELAPVVFAALGLAAVVWSVRRAFDAWSASLTAAALVCFSGGGVAGMAAGGLATMFALDAHANTVITAAICGAGLIWALPRIEQLSLLKCAAIACAIGVLGGLPLAGDELYLAWGLGPVLVVLVLAAWRGPQSAAPRTLAFGLLTLVITVLTVMVFAAIMRGAGVHGYGASHHALVRFTTPDGIIKNFQTLLWALPSLSASSFYGKALASRSELELVNAALLFAALFAVVWSVRRRVASLEPRQDRGGDVIDARFVHTVFWASVLGLGLFAFMIGSPAVWSTDGRYLLGPYVAIGALLPMLISRGMGWRLMVTAAISIFVLSTIYQFPSELREMRSGYQSARAANAVAAYAQQEHVAVGYGYYWTSIDLMWNSDFKVKVYPIQNCRLLDKHKTDFNFCTHTAISMSNWFKPRPGIRSMLVINRASKHLARHVATLGPPIATTRIGTLLVYVYPFDIATKLGRTRLTF